MKLFAYFRHLQSYQHRVCDMSSLPTIGLISFIDLLDLMSNCLVFPDGKSIPGDIMVMMAVRLQRRKTVPNTALLLEVSMVSFVPEHNGVLISFQPEMSLDVESTSQLTELSLREMVSLLVSISLQKAQFNVSSATSF